MGSQQPNQNPKNVKNLVVNVSERKMSAVRQKHQSQQRVPREQKVPNQQKVPREQKVPNQQKVPTEQKVLSQQKVPSQQTNQNPKNVKNLVVNVSQRKILRNAKGLLRKWEHAKERKMSA